MDPREIVDPEASQRPMFRIESVKPSGTAIDSKRGTLKPLMGSKAPKAGTSNPGGYGMMLRRSPEIDAGLFVTGQGINRRDEKRDDADAGYSDRLFSILLI
jgi:hypothetical protein